MKTFIRSSLVAVLLFTGCDAVITIKPGEHGSNTVATVSIDTKPHAEPKSSLDAKPKSSTEAKSDETKPAPPPKPAWVSAPPGLHGGVYETSVVIGPETTREACEEKLRPAVESATARYVSNEYGPAADQSLDVRFASLPSRVVGPSWEERVELDGEESIFLHTQLRFDDQLRTEWRHHFDRWTTRLRTIEVVKNVAMAMGALLIVHLGLRWGPRRGSAV